MKEDVSLAKVLGRKDVLSLAFGSMIGWSWVMLAGSWVSQAGFVGAIAAFVISGIMSALVGLAYAELATTFPLAGGEFVYSYRAMGTLAAWISGWAITFAYLGIVAFEGVAFVAAVDYLVRIPRMGYLWSIAGQDVYVSWAMVGVVMGGSLCYFNYRGIKSASRFQNWATLFLAVGGTSFFITGALRGSISNVGPILQSTPGFASVLLMCPALYLGFGVIPQVAEEVNIPTKVVGKLLVFSVLLAVLWYVMIIFGVGMAAPSEVRATYDIPVADSMASLLNSDIAGGLIILAGIAGIITSWNAFIIAASRILFAMGRAKLLPPIFSSLHPKHQTPWFSILLVFVVSTIAPFLGRNALMWFLNASSLGSTVAYVMVAIALLVLKKKEPGLARPYSMSSIAGYIALVISVGFLLLFLPISPAALKLPEWTIVFIWAIIGMLLAAAAKPTMAGVSWAERERLIFGGELARIGAGAKQQPGDYRNID